MKRVYHDQLISLFANRTNFNDTERRLYSHDIGEMPGALAAVFFRKTAEGIVQPETEAELQALVNWSRKTGIPLVPRGKATSGYGGVLPVAGGIVVDFYRYRSILKLDSEAGCVSVQPGITWEKLDFYLRAQGFTLRMYPSSYPSSTVGGWLAQGGAGFGSYQYGYFRDNVIQVTLITPQGEKKILKAGELDLVSEAQGITGLISEVTIPVLSLQKALQGKDDFQVAGYVLENPEQLEKFLTAMVDEKPDLWSLNFIDARLASLKNHAPIPAHESDAQKQILPEKIIAIAAFAPSLETENLLASLATRSGGKALPDEIARHEWQNRFKIMGIKRLGPSLVPCEVIVPVKNCREFLEKAAARTGNRFGFEMVTVNSPKGAELVMLGFLPSDRSRLRFYTDYLAALTVMKTAMKLGGRPYATGYYFSHLRRRIFSPEALKTLKVSAGRFMNPGKVLGNGLMGIFMRFAFFGEPLMRPFLRITHPPTSLSEKIPAAKRGIPGDIIAYSRACSQCGYCIDECDQFYGRGWESQSPRGKWYWLRDYVAGKVEFDQFMVDTFLACTTCELCNHRCSAALPIESSWLRLRGELIQERKHMTFPPFEMMNSALKSEGNIWAGYRKDRDRWFPEELERDHYPAKSSASPENGKSKAVYFAGCTASYVEHDIAIGSVRLLHEAGVDFTYLGCEENCCGTPMLVAGKWDTFRDTMLKNIAAVRKTGADTVITSCPACDMMWRSVYKSWMNQLGMEYDIKTRHYSEMVGEQITAGKFKFPESGSEKETVTWHDSCHIGRVSGVYDPPRQVIEAMNDVNLVEMAHNREKAHCCGSVLTLIKEPDVAADIGESRLQEAIDAGAQRVLALCPCCEFQLRTAAEKKNVDIKITDLARFSAEKLGYTLPDPHPEVRKQWAVFEKMIALMTPKGFASILGTMWPELMEAMPLKMGKLMKILGKIPGIMRMMKPAFPLLFPILLPRMLPKLIPTLSDRIHKVVPMPDYMAEQMPDLLPEVMDGLLPHMVDEVVTLVSDPMIAYLRTGESHEIAA